MVGITPDTPYEPPKTQEPANPTKELVLRYMEEKDKIEREIQELRELLVEKGDVDMRGPLVDAHGNPRDDIDSHRIRTARQQICSLQSDHRAIMKFIEDGIHLVHAEARGEGPSNANGSAAGGSADPANEHDLCSNSYIRITARTKNMNTEGAFLRVNIVRNGSPADIAGIRVDDLILQFGSINYINFTSLYQIGRLVENSVNAPIEVRLRRVNDIVNLTLVPQEWAGRGLLGCNVVCL